MAPQDDPPRSGRRVEHSSAASEGTRDAEALLYERLADDVRALGQGIAATGRDVAVVTSEMRGLDQRQRTHESVIAELRTYKLGAKLVAGFLAILVAIMGFLGWSTLDGIDARVDERLDEGLTPRLKRVDSLIASVSAHSLDSLRVAIDFQRVEASSLLVQVERIARDLTDRERSARQTLDRLPQLLADKQSQIQHLSQAIDRLSRDFSSRETVARQQIARLDLLPSLDTTIVRRALALPVNNTVNSPAWIAGIRRFIPIENFQALELIAWPTQPISADAPIDVIVRLFPPTDGDRAVALGLLIAREEATFSNCAPLFVPLVGFNHLQCPKQPAGDYTLRVLLYRQSSAADSVPSIVTLSTTLRIR